jgi:hypothetical protein
MITLEQIRLLESKITRALELIRVLKDENSTLRKGLESAQRRMRELETLVDGFKTDQKEIESVIVRTLHNLDELEESAAAASAAGAATAAPGGVPAGGIQAAGVPGSGMQASAGSAPTSAPAGARAEARAAAPGGMQASGTPSSKGSAAGAQDADDGSTTSKEELDIF